MPTVITHEEKVWPNFESGVAVPGVVTGVKLVKGVPGYGGKLVNKLYVKVLTNEISEGERMTALFTATASMHRDSNLRKFIKQIMNGDVGESFDCELLVGKQGNFVFENVTSEKTGRTYSNIVNVLRPTTKVTIPSDHVAFREDGENTIKQANKPAAPRPRPRQTVEVIPDAAPTAIAEI